VQPAQTVVALNQWLRDYTRNNGLVNLDYYAPMVYEKLGLRKEL